MVKVYNAYFEGLDGFHNTKNGADRVRKLMEENDLSLGEALDTLFAAMFGSVDTPYDLVSELDYVMSELAKLRENVKDDF